MEPQPLSQSNSNHSLVMHIDMDAFFASVEQQVNPKLKGKPVIVGGRDNKYHSIVCAASYEAKALGIDSAMLSWKAFQICPQAIFVPADTPKYVHTSSEIFKILKSFCPQVEVFAIDEFFLNFDGCERLLGPIEVIGLEIKKAIHKRFGITCSVGIAPTKMTSKLAAKLKKPDGLVFLPTKEAVYHAIENLPIEKICGIGPRLKKRFNYLGVMLCRDLANFPDRLLKEHFGIVGLWLKKICLAEDAGVILNSDQNAPPKSVGHSQTLREVSMDRQYICNWIYLLSEMVGERLRRMHLQARTVHFFLSDGFEEGWSKQKTFEHPSNDGQEIYWRCLQIMKLLHLDQPRARVLGVSVTQLERADENFLFEKQFRRTNLLKHLDDINHRFGEWTICPASLREATYAF